LKRSEYQSISSDLCKLINVQRELFGRLNSTELASVAKATERLTPIIGQG
jgi:hypothetical protein